jgi:hypothetical protein
MADQALPHGTGGRQDTANALLNESPAQQVTAARAALAAVALEYEAVPLPVPWKSPAWGWPCAKSAGRAGKPLPLDTQRPHKHTRLGTRGLRS